MSCVNATYSYGGYTIPTRLMIVVTLYGRIHTMRCHYPRPTLPIFDFEGAWR